jgi:hypothetical protein
MSRPGSRPATRAESVRPSGAVSATSRSGSTVWFAVTTIPGRQCTPVDGSRGRPCTATTEAAARSTAPASALERSITVVIVLLSSWTAGVPLSDPG